MPSNEFNRVASEKLADGRIALGGVNGIVIFDPKDFDNKNKESSVLPLQIIGLKMLADGVEKNYPFQDYLNAVSPLPFPATFEQIIVDFQALNPLLEGIHYFFRLDAKTPNSEWTEVNDPELVFNQLNYGRHKLEMAIQDGLNDEIIGHELRAPLLDVIGLSKKAAYLLKNGKMDSLEKMSKQIDRYAHDTQTMLQNLLNWGQIMVQETKVHVEPIQLEEFVNEMIAHCVDLAQPKEISLMHEIPANTTIHFDEEALKIILRNLVVNAIKFLRRKKGSSEWLIY